MSPACCHVWAVIHPVSQVIHLCLPKAIAASPSCPSNSQPDPVAMSLACMIPASFEMALPKASVPKSCAIMREGQEAHL